jgi:hypothetical protein
MSTFPGAVHSHLRAIELRTLTPGFHVKHGCGDGNAGRLWEGHLDEVHASYSVFEHAQSEELPSSALELDVFEADVIALQKWIAEFGSRAS